VSVIFERHFQPRQILQGGKAREKEGPNYWRLKGGFVHDYLATLREIFEFMDCSVSNIKKEQEYDALAKGPSELL